METDELMRYIGDNNEVALYFSKNARTVYLLGKCETDLVEVMITFNTLLIKNHISLIKGAKGIFFEDLQTTVIIHLNYSDKYYLSDVPIENPGECRIIDDLTFCSTDHIWSMDMNIKCIPLTVHGATNEGDQVLSNIDLTINPLSKKKNSNVEKTK